MTVTGYQKRKQLEGQIKRICIYSLLLFLLRIAECSFFERLQILPAAPDLILAALTVVALIDTRETSLLTAIVGGVLTDAVGSTGIYLSPLFYFVLVLILSSFAKKMMKSYLSYLALMPLSILLRALYTFGRGALFGNAAVLGILRYACLPEAICTAVFCLAVYPITVICVEPLLRDNK